ncbi:MAG: phage tail protein, partial [Lapillicoccus sp.]
MGTFEVRLSWDGAVVPGLRAVGALQASVGVVTLYDGMLDHVVKVPGRPDTAPVTLEREVSDDLTFDQWARGPHLRKEVELTLVDTAGGPTVAYRMHQCWVSAYAVAPDVETGVALERITLSMNGWERVAPEAPELAERFAAQRGTSVVRV